MTRQRPGPHLAPVLIADDHEGSRSLLVTLLQQNGYSVLDVADGFTALRVALQQPLLAILADWSMPGLNGGELIEALQRRGVAVPIVIMTASGEHARAAAGLGIHGVLLKPVEPSALLEMLEVLVATQSGVGLLDHEDAARHEQPD